MKSEKSVLHKLVLKFENLLKYMTIVLMIGMVLLVFTNVISRYFLNAAIAWSEEISRFMLIWLVFLGAVLAYTKDEHLGLDILVKALPPKASKLVAILADILVIVAVVLILHGGYALTMKNWEWKSPAAAIPYAYVYLIVPISGTILLLQTLFKMMIHIKELFSNSTSDKEEKLC